ncbi:MAG: ATP synthase F1 subunit epsilon [bacterium]|nr:ATP synthase F1 subunit epsilon [bacterium]MCP4800349.1 ATP synthase F1 subunit epsilon [bacterium]
MSKAFKITIVTAERQAYEGEAVSVILPGISGYLGVLANHAPLVTALVPGVLTIRTDDSNTEYLAIGTGFVEIANNAMSIMCDSCEKAVDIDVGRAENARDRAAKRLAENGSDLDKPRAQMSLDRARARIQANLMK